MAGTWLDQRVNNFIRLLNYLPSPDFTYRMVYLVKTWTCVYGFAGFQSSIVTRSAPSYGPSGKSPRFHFNASDITQI